MVQSDTDIPVQVSDTAHATVGDSDTDSNNSDPLDLSPDEGWEDVEPDVERVNVVSLLDDEVFPDVHSMLEHCKTTYHFDFMKIRRDLDLDFFESVKFVNYIRSEAKAGHLTQPVTRSAFADDRYLKPAMEDDTLLYSLDDLDGNTAVLENTTNEPERLKDELYVTKRKAKDLQEDLERLQEKFNAYKEAVQISSTAQLDTEAQSLPHVSSASPVAVSLHHVQCEEDYFGAYSSNGIHETMLKDTVRTDAYRDFIYENKHIFKDKVVLDVGCGTGILSMLCAKAGAKMVIAVDNSDIIDKARVIVHKNGLDGVVKCLRGKVEEVTLPISQVDVIVSEWMGYCLLFEHMLDSVIWARDHYLSPTGLMIPSHGALRIAPYSDPQYVEESICYWNSVYGFDMSNMLEGVYKDVQIRTVASDTIVAKADTFRALDLHSIPATELEFTVDFSVALDKDIDALDGWIVWFDMFFMPSRNAVISPDVTPSDMTKKGAVAFTTGPHGRSTHWEQGIFLIDRTEKPPTKLEKGNVIAGQVRYQKALSRGRSLDIEMNWRDEFGVEKGVQTWEL